MLDKKLEVIVFVMFEVIVWAMLPLLSTTLGTERNAIHWLMNNPTPWESYRARLQFQKYLNPKPETLRPETYARALPTPYTLHPPPSTLHPTPYTLHPPPSTLHPPPYTPHPTPYTLHSTPYTLHPTPYTLHLAPYTLHPTILNAPQQPECGGGVTRDK